MEDFFKAGSEEIALTIASTVTSFKILIIKILQNNSISESDVVTSAVTSAGVSLTTLFLLMEFFSQMTSKWFERMEDAIQLGIKMIVAKIIIENSSTIVGGISGYFKDLGTANIESGFDSITSNIIGLTVPGDAGPFGIGYILLTLFLYIIWAVVIIMLIMLTIEILGIVFEIGIHMAVGPIALSTLCNSTFRSTGLSFIKSYTAVCLQTTVIGAICKVYTKFATNLNLTNITATGMAANMVAYCMPLLGLAVLCVTIKKSSDITKRMFGA
ncbi:MAG: hypothetical protein HFJ89_10520 [Oscillospiraceae bacterium]|nr:hypothetical protein [Oscillospiraceae bacterium]MCX4376515.1 hypothetical protein [Lachnospiraceae bacterium]